MAMISRRQMLVAGAAAAVISGCGCSSVTLAGAGEEGVAADAGLTTHKSFGAFMNVSRRLTGRQSLNLKLASKLFDALIAGDSGLPAAIEALKSFWRKHDSVLPVDLIGELKRGAPELADLPVTLISAWYLGQVGPAGAVIAYEDTLMFAPVADILTPPSFCGGDVGYWAAEPGPI